MNIALFSDTYVPEINGVAASTSNLARVMMSHGHQCIVVTSNPYSNEVTFEDGVIRIPGFDMKRYYGYNMAFSNPKAMKIIERFRPDIVHCQSDGGMGIFGPQVAKKLHIACVYTFHTMVEDYTYYVTGGHFDRAARQFVRTFYQTSLQRFDH
ncbi:MAG: glycosyltransferase, partial [Bacilli bacterium]|nr:glycosyltransferase [Bacilli bacterium]